MNEKNKKKIESLEEDILKHELNIEKWTKERQKINKDIAESRKEIVRIEDDISNLKYAEVFNLIQESKLDPSVALNLIQNKINQTQNEVINNDSEDVVDE